MDHTVLDLANGVEEGITVELLTTHEKPENEAVDPADLDFVIFRLYSPTQAFFDQSWKPGDITKTK